MTTISHSRLVMTPARGIRRVVQPAEGRPTGRHRLNTQPSLWQRLTRRAQDGGQR